MGFLTPKAPKVVKAPPPAIPAVAASTTPPDTPETGILAPSSLVSTTPQGLTRKAETRRTSLLGGTSA